MSRPAPDNSSIRASRPGPLRLAKAIALPKAIRRAQFPSRVLDISDRLTPYRLCLRSLDCSCCCEAGCCFPDCRSRSARSVPPTLLLRAESGLSSCSPPLGFAGYEIDTDAAMSEQGVLQTFSSEKTAKSHG